jgi:hypothetical protein
VTNLAKNVKWGFDVRIDGGPTKTLSDNLEVDAVDSLNITIPKSTTTDKSIEVQPGDIQDVKLLYIKSNVHNGISYKLSGSKDASNDNSPIELDTDHILNSSKIVGLIGKNPKFIKFQNTSSTDNADIEIMTARSAS